MEGYGNTQVKNNIILLDVDDVIANLIDSWLSTYNTYSGDNLKPENILDWDISKFVPCEYKTFIYEILHDPQLYDKVKPVNGSLEGVNRLITKGFRIVYLTSPIIETAGVKFNWLLKNKFPIKLEDYIEANDKSLIFGDFMIDDGIHNIEKTRAGDALLFSQPWNKNYEGAIRVNNWNEILEWFGV